MDKKFDVVALGELLVDFTQGENSSCGNWTFEANAGGAPCNVLAMLSKLGRKTAFIGKVGADFFGEMLEEKIKSVGIDTKNLVKSKTEKTTLAFVHTDFSGDRSFSFYRNPGADASLEKNEVREEIVASSKILHFGSLSMTNPCVAEATETAILFAESHGVLKSFDPNLRMNLWSAENLAKEKILFGISKCDILKISEEELEFVTGESDIQKGVKKIKSEFPIRLITVTKGKNGCEAFYDYKGENFHIECPTFTSVKTIDTTGAGDTFCACVLHFILETGYDFSKEKLEEALKFANAASSLITTKKGALMSMPEVSEIDALIKNGR